MNATTKRALVALAVLALVAGCGRREETAGRPRPTGAQAVRTVLWALRQVPTECGDPGFCPADPPG